VGPEPPRPICSIEKDAFLTPEKGVEVRWETLCRKKALKFALIEVVDLLLDSLLIFVVQSRESVNTNHMKLLLVHRNICYTLLP
jgi:hypothetical protein